jgi:hypothetical protein
MVAQADAAELDRGKPRQRTGGGRERRSKIGPICAGSADVRAAKSGIMILAVAVSGGTTLQRGKCQGGEPMDLLQRQVRRAQRWLGLQRFVWALGWCWFGTLLVALVLILVDKFWPLGVAAWAWVAAALALGILAAAAWAVVRGRGPVDAAIEIDRRFRLKERVSSTLAMSEDQRRTEAGQALIEDAVRRVKRIDVGEHFSISPGRQILLPLIPAVAAALVWWLVGPAVVDRGAQADAATVKNQIKESSGGLKRKLQQQKKRAEDEGLKDAQMLFEKLEEATEDLADKSTDRKEALVKLNDLNRQMENRRQQLGGAAGIKEQLEKLDKIGQGPAEKFLKAVANGDLKSAAKELDELKSKLARNELSNEDRAQLASQLEEMKSQLQRSVEERQQRIEDLQNQLQQARAQGNDEEADRLQQQLDNLQMQSQQMNNLENLANQLGQCAQALGAGELQDASNLLDQIQSDLDDLQGQLQEMEMLGDAMDQLSQARDQMNCQQCGGFG